MTKFTNKMTLNDYFDAVSKLKWIHHDEECDYHNIIKNVFGASENSTGKSQCTAIAHVVKSNSCCSLEDLNRLAEDSIIKGMKMCASVTYPSEITFNTLHASYNPTQAEDVAKFFWLLLDSPNLKVAESGVLLKKFGNQPLLSPKVQREPFFGRMFHVDRWGEAKEGEGITEPSDGSHRLLLFIATLLDLKGLLP